MIYILVWIIFTYLYTGVLINLISNTMNDSSYDLSDVISVLVWPYVLKEAIKLAKKSKPEIKNAVINKELVEPAEPMPTLFVSIPYNKLPAEKEKELISRMVETAKKKFSVTHFDVVLGVDPKENAKQRVNQILDTEYFVGLLNKSLYDKYPELDKDNYICMCVAPENKKKFFIQVVHE